MESGASSVLLGVLYENLPSDVDPLIRPEAPTSRRLSMTRVINEADVLRKQISLYLDGSRHETYMFVNVVALALSDSEAS